MVRNIKLHSCRMSSDQVVRAALVPGQNYVAVEPGSLPQWFFALPPKCGCKKWLSPFEADEMHATGYVESVWRGGTRGPHTIDSEVSFTGKALRTPRSAAIEQEHIVEAYVYENAEAAERIEAYGLSTLWARIKCNKFDKTDLSYTRRAFRPDPFDGRVILINFDDDRTSGHN